MPHYRFSAVFNGTNSNEVGEYLFDDEAAKLHAAQIIQELKYRRDPMLYDGWSLRIIDGERQVAVIPFRLCT